MKVRTRLLFSTVFLSIVVLLINLVVFVSGQRVNQANQKELLANNIVRGASDLNVLTDDYLLYNPERAKLQWQIRYAMLNKLITTQNISDTQTQGRLEKIEKDLAQSKILFTQLTATTNVTSEKRERLIGQLKINSQLVLSAALRLSSEALHEREIIRQDTDLFIFSFIFAMVLVTLITFYFLYRAIAGPITNLSSVAKQVHKGNLSKRTIVKAKDELGELADTFNSMLDALEESHKDLEKKVQMRTKELEASNKELESFSYSVSHDLRAPLRSIDGFSEILQQEYLAKVDEEGKDVIKTIRNNTHQMENLIDDLLAFSRLGRQPVATQIVNMKRMVHEVYADLKKTTRSRKMNFSCEDLPTIKADPALIKQVWINLLSNAIKYTKNQQEAIIIVGSKREKDKIIYFVKDNGAGFDMKYVHKLFGVFQRLHSNTDFEGTGVGLAIVQRIITKHGGKVWAEGEVNKGATFYFSLPSDVAIE